MDAFSSALDSTPTSFDYEDILYESSFEANYCDSISEGVANGQAQMIAYNKRCPKSKLVVSGYSQGAYVVGDMFAGGGGTFGDCVQASNEPFDVDSDAGKMGKILLFQGEESWLTLRLVTAILMWGSKRHTASQPYNTFSGADKNGTYPRPEAELDALKQWTPVLRDYCVVTDPNCAGGKVNEDHWNYFELYSDQAVEWMKNQVDNNITAASELPSSNGTVTSSAESSTMTQSSVIGSGTPVVTTTSTSLSATSTTSSSAASSSTAGSAASTSRKFNMVGLAVAGLLAACM